MLASQCDIVEDANAIAMTTVTITDEPQLNHQQSEVSDLSDEFDRVLNV